jgi:hypothetical protein
MNISTPKEYHKGKLLNSKRRITKIEKKLTNEKHRKKITNEKDKRNSRNKKK